MEEPVVRVYIWINHLEKIGIHLHIQPNLRCFLSDKNHMNSLVGAVEKNVTAFHNLIRQPITGTIWEEILSNSFSDVGYNTTWKPDNSHKVGEDMSISELMMSRISCKSGVFKKNKSHNLGSCVQFSSSRTTSFKTLKDKLNHLSKSHYDYHFMLSKNDKFDGTYKLLIIDANVCNVNDVTWESNKNGKPDDYVTKVGGPFKGVISAAMSGQLWVTLPLTHVHHIYDISSPK
jgi:hypothetical protein